MTETPNPTTPRLEPVHDFVAKLRQPGLVERVQAYVDWQRAVRAARRSGEAPPPLPDWAPLSINLDLTTACNFACDHCIDWDILNSGIAHHDEHLQDGLARLAARGLRSVILIGGGEPTVHPRFREVVAHLKDLGLQIAVVTNGSRNERIVDVADRLDERDWMRMSLDAGTDATFQAMHRPKRPITLEAICEGAAAIKAKNPAPRVGFSFLVTWRGAARDDVPIVENLDEIPAAARLARDHGFDYIAFKPILTRAPDGAEVMDPDAAQETVDAVVRRIRERIDEARPLASERFAVIESTNLRLLESGAWRDWTAQPRTCHMQAFRQVLSPLGLWNCPAHRGVPKAKIAGREAWATDVAAAETHRRTQAMLDGFDASVECAEVTCLYHAANWWLERAIEDPRQTIEPVVNGRDAFL